MGRLLTRAGAELRQWRHPREFRIQPSGWPADALAGLAHAIAGLDETRSAAASAHAAAGSAPGAAGFREVGGGEPGVDVGGPPDVRPAAGFPEDELADLATSVWRLRGRVARMDDPPRALVRHVETAWDALADGGVEIRDHAGEPFDPGQVMSVAAYQPTPGLHREQIIETVRPGVYLGERSIQLAEVIVGTPESPGGAAAGATEGTRAR